MNYPICEKCGKEVTAGFTALIKPNKTYVWHIQCKPMFQYKEFNKEDLCTPNNPTTWEK